MEKPWMPWCPMLVTAASTTASTLRSLAVRAGSGGWSDTGRNLASGAAAPTGASRSGTGRRNETLEPRQRPPPAVVGHRSVEHGGAVVAVKPMVGVGIAHDFSRHRGPAG